jgi:hypothetical protein
MNNHSGADSIHVEAIEKILNTIVDVQRNTFADDQSRILQLFLHFQNSSCHRLHHRRVSIADDIQRLIESETSKVASVVDERIELRSLYAILPDTNLPEVNPPSNLCH